MSGPIMRVVDTITLRGLAATIATSLCLFQMGAASTAKAQGLTSNSDIVGLRTTMTRDQIKQLIQQQFGTSKFPPKTLKFGTPEYSRDVILGFTGDILSKEDKEANQKRLDELNKEYERRRAAGCNSPLCQSVASGLITDTINVYVDPNPNASGVLALVRQTEYPKTTDILVSVLIQSLIDKFGKPSFIDQYGTYYWAEGVGTNPNLVIECSRFAEDIGKMEASFSKIMNGFANGTTKQPKCSTYLSVIIKRIGKPGQMNPDYVWGFSMVLVNVQTTYSALSAYAADFWAAANKAKQDKLSKESQNKPKL